jgi:hypothetical protein
VLGNEGSRANFGVVAFLGIAHESLLNISVLQGLSIGNFGKMLEIGKLGVFGVTNKVVVSLNSMQCHQTLQLDILHTWYFDTYSTGE